MIPEVVTDSLSERSDDPSAAFKDAHSDDFDSLLETVVLYSQSSEHDEPPAEACNSRPDSPAMAMSPNDMESSLRIRRKYGLAGRAAAAAAKGASPASSFASSTARAAAVNEEASGRDYDGEARIIFATTQLVVCHFLEELVSGDIVENEHALLDPLLALVEMALSHGWRGGDGSRTGRQRPPSAIFHRPRGYSQWDLLRRIEKWAPSSAGAGQSSIANVKQFTTLPTASAKIRMWMRLALMKKSLSSDLTAVITNDSTLVS